MQVVEGVAYRVEKTLWADGPFMPMLEKFEGHGACFDRRQKLVAASLMRDFY